MADKYSADFWQQPPCFSQIVTYFAGPLGRRSNQDSKACRLARGHDGECDIRPTDEDLDRWLTRGETITP